MTNKGLTLGHFLSTFTDYRANGSEPLVTSVVIDSRRASAGALFLTFNGEQVDGHDYVAAAFAKGAIAALVERPVEGFKALDCRKGAAVPAGNITMPVQLIVDDVLNVFSTCPISFVVLETFNISVSFDNLSINAPLLNGIY